LHYAFVEVIGLGTLNLIVGALTGLFLWGSANGLQATAVLATLWIIGGVMWLVIKKYAWDRRPSIMKTAEAKIYQHEPVASIPQVTPEPVPQVIKPEEPKQETAAQ
jgi:hypothetical protein